MATDYQLDDSKIHSKMSNVTSGTAGDAQTVATEKIPCPSTWSSRELAKHLSENGLGDYAGKIMAHKINGKLVNYLGDEDLREMGITIVGDRLRFKQCLLSLQRKTKYNLNTRNKAIWEGTERRYYSTGEQNCYTCYGIMPDDPGTYKLTSSQLKIKTVNPLRFGPTQLRCWFEYGLKTIDLNDVKEVDVMTTAAPCPQRVFCCAPGRDLVEIQTDDVPRKRVVLQLKEGEGEYVSGLIMAQAEEAQMIDRD